MEQATINFPWLLNETGQRSLLMSEALSPDRILLFFGRETSYEIVQLLSQTFENVEKRHVLNAIRAYMSDDMSATAQILHARLPGLRETQAALAVSRLGAERLCETPVRTHVFLLLVSPLENRFSERAYLRRISRLFAAKRNLDACLSRLLSADAVLETIRQAEL